MKENDVHKEFEKLVNAEVRFSVKERTTLLKNFFYYCAGASFLASIIFVLASIWVPMTGYQNARTAFVLIIVSGITFRLAIWMRDNEHNYDV